MKDKEDILALIKSLSKSEKRYFKLYVSKNSRSENSHYIKLFDLIEKAGTSEKKIIQKLYEDDNFIEKQFSVYKILLFKQILKSLNSFHSESSVEDQILESIRQTKILIDKGLFNYAQNILAKAKSIALKHEKFTHILEIVRLEKKIINIYGIYNESKESDLIQLYEEEKSVVEKIGNENEYWKLNAQLYLYYRMNGHVRKQEDINKYHSIIETPILKNEKHAASYHAKSLYYSIYINYFNALNNFKEAYVNNHKMIQLIESHPFQIQNNSTIYYNGYYNLLVFSLELKKYAELFNLLPKIKSIYNEFPVTISDTIRSFLLKNTYNIEFEAYYDTGQFDKAAEVLIEIEGLSKDQKNKFDLPELILAINKTRLHFANRSFHKALTSINYILNEEINNLREDQFCYIRIFQLIIHYEIGNTDLLPYLVKSVYRYLLKKKYLFKIESIFIQVFRTKLFHINNKKEEIKVFKALREELMIAFEDPMEAKFREFFDIISWLEGKIGNRPFGEILREKSGYIE